MVTTTEEPINGPNFVFIQNAPLLLPKKRLLPPRSPHNDQILYLFKTPTSSPKTVVHNFYLFKTPPYFNKSRYYHHGAYKLTKYCIYLTPPTSHPSYSKTSGTKFCIYSKRPPSYSKKSGYNYKSMKFQGYFKKKQLLPQG